MNNMTDLFGGLLFFVYFWSVIYIIIMAYALVTPVKESVKELRLALKTAIPFLQPRIKLLLVLKKYDNMPVSKRELMEQTGLCSYSVHKWRTMYMTGGMECLLKHNKKGFKPSKLTAEQHSVLAAKLKDPENGIRGYKELQQWVLKEFKSEISYNTLLKYCIRHFGSKVKVARKYHAKKDNEQVAAFKKTLPKPVKKP
jgi:transposase